MADKNTDCGPKKLKACGEGSKGTEDEAIEDAGKNARARAQKLCHGGYGERRHCNYLELEAELVSVEPKTTPQGAQVFVAKIVTQGQCQCE